MKYIIRLVLVFPALLIYGQAKETDAESLCSMAMRSGRGELSVRTALQWSSSRTWNDPALDTLPGNAPRISDPEAACACVWKILENCPWHRELPYCKSVGLLDRPETTLRYLQAWQGACPFRASASAALPKMRGDRGARLCVALVAAGGSPDCLSHYRKEIVREFLRRRQVGARETDNWLFPYLARFWMPRYLALGPWLRSLPETSPETGYQSMRAFAIGFQTHDDEMVISAFRLVHANLELYDWVVYKYRPETDWLGLLEKSGLKPEWLKAIREAHERNQRGAYQSLHMVSEFDSGYCAEPMGQSIQQQKQSTKTRHEILFFNPPSPRSGPAAGPPATPG